MQRKNPVIKNGAVKRYILTPDAFNAVISLFFCKRLIVITVEMRIAIGKAILIYCGIEYIYIIEISVNGMGLSSILSI